MVSASAMSNPVKEMDRLHHETGRLSDRLVGEVGWLEHHDRRVAAGGVRLQTLGLFLDRLPGRLGAALPVASVTRPGKKADSHNLLRMSAAEGDSRRCH